ncbi:SHOCT domain-containing protein [Halorhabdus sp. BNX81]|uniref:SHOCT domain-containing protein n=1 Tax=Halorhabdus sp. BNX81 TaxID=2980181 RepID=UPI0023DCF75C|nr:SHOCT domain-containing protein [Halorhabdus sp. BNX81]WEL20533.1 putative membrane protein [Halorhabdus sp. BNX81]
MLSERAGSDDDDRTAQNVESTRSRAEGGRVRRGIARVGVLGVALLATVGTASAQHGGGGMMGGGGYGGFGIPGFGLVFWLLLGLGVVGLFAYARDGRRFRPDTAAGTAPGQEHTDRALETLRERYARGELTDEEFERRRAELERSR